MIDISRVDRSVLLRVDRILAQQLERATEILKQYRPTRERLVDALVAGLKLSGQEVVDAIGDIGQIESLSRRTEVSSR